MSVNLLAFYQQPAFHRCFSSAQHKLQVRQSSPTAQSHVALERAGTSFFQKKDATASKNGKFWLSLVGVALAGASWCVYKREIQVSVAVSNRQRLRGAFADIYGPQGETQPPAWLSDEDAKRPDGTPSWLTLQKWTELEKSDQRRNARWWSRAFDSSGKKMFSRDEPVGIDKAVEILFSMHERVPSEIDETFECQMNMNLDSKYPDQQIRTSIRLPHGTGKSVKVAVFSSPEEDEEMEKLGAYKYGERLVKDISEEKIDFDVLIAKPQAMPRLAKLGKILGPRRLMPSPKSGTVVTDYAKALEDFQGGVIELRNDKNSLVHCGIGKVSFGRQKIKDNFRAVLQQMADKKPAGASKDFWNRVFMGTSQCPSIPIANTELPQIVIKDDDSDDED